MTAEQSIHAGIREVVDNVKKEYGIRIISVEVRWLYGATVEIVRIVTESEAQDVARKP